MHLELFIAWRYLRAKRKQAAISIISAISILGIAAGVMALIIALALLTGFNEEFQSRILGATPHIDMLRSNEGNIENYQGVMDKVRAVPHVLGVAPVISKEVFLSGPAGSHWALLKGIDLSLQRSVSDLLQYRIIDGDSSPLAATPGRSEDAAAVVERIMLGKELANRLGASVGDFVTVISPQGRLSPIGMVPRYKKAKVIAIFESGFWQFDEVLAFTSIPSAQKIFGLPEGAITRIEAKVDNIYEAGNIGNAIAISLGEGFYVSNWMDLNKPLFSALKLEKLAMFVAIGLIVFVASLNIISTLIMMVLEKQKDIAILSTMGATERTVMLVFILQGLIVGLVGTLIGSVLGYTSCWLLNTYKIIRIPAEVYNISYVPFKIKPLDFSLVTLLALLVSFLATIYPARSAARLNPIETLRYE